MQLNETQVTILYGFGALVLLMALGALYAVEYKSLRAVRGEIADRQRELESLRAGAPDAPESKRTDELQRELVRLRSMAAPHGEAAALALTQLTALRKELGLPPLRYSLARPEVEPWPKEAPAAGPVPGGLEAVTWHVTLDCSYWQLLRLLNALERWEQLACVAEVVVARAPGALAPGQAPLRVGLALEVYAAEADFEGERVALSPEQRRALLGEVHALGLKPAEARDPFDPFPALTPAD